MLLKDEMKLEQKLNQSGTTKGGRAKATKKADSGKRKKLIALRDLRHQLDEVSARRVILSKENEEARRSLVEMRAHLTQMPLSVQLEMQKSRQATVVLLSRDSTSERDAAKNMRSIVNVNIRESLYSMNLTTTSMPLLAAATTATHFALCSSLLAAEQQVASAAFLARKLPVVSSVPSAFMDANGNFE